MGWEKRLGIQSAFVHERKGAAPKLQKHSFIPFYFFFFSYIYEGTNGSRNVVCFRLSRPHDFPSTTTKGAKRPFPNSFPYVSTCIRDSGRRQRVQTGTNYHMIQVYQSTQQGKNNLGGYSHIFLDTIKVQNLEHLKTFCKHSISISQFLCVFSPFLSN